MHSNSRNGRTHTHTTSEYKILVKSKRKTTIKSAATKATWKAYKNRPFVCILRLSSFAVLFRLLVLLLLFLICRSVADKCIFLDKCVCVFVWCHWLCVYVFPQQAHNNCHKYYFFLLFSETKTLDRFLSLLFSLTLYLSFQLLLSIFKALIAWFYVESITDIYIIFISM